MSSNKWKDVFCSVYKKRSHRRWKSVSKDMLAVAHSIKPAYLFDQWSSSPEEMTKLLQLVYDEGLTLIKLDLIVINTDLIVYSRHSCPKNFQHSKVKYVDVSFNLQKPALVDRVKISSTMESFASFIEFVTNCQQMQESEIDDTFLNLGRDWYEVKVTEDINPTCLFGMFLGYPFVYWFDISVNDNNCLSMQPLRHYQVKGLDTPHCRCNANVQHSSNDSESNSLHRGGRRESGRDELESCNMTGKESVCSFNGMTRDFDHILFSFSIPEEVLALDTSVEQSVMDWFLGWRNSTNWNKLFSHVWLERNTVTLEAVSL